MYDGLVWRRLAAVDLRHAALQSARVRLEGEPEQVFAQIACSGANRARWRETADVGTQISRRLQQQVVRMHAHDKEVRLLTVKVACARGIQRVDADRLVERRAIVKRFGAR